jgi:hypothetical protein
MNIQFQNPGFLYGLFAVAIPIIVHLFKFRKLKVVYFSNTAMLQQLKNETVSRTRIKHLLVLLARILTIIALVLAFAMPFIPVTTAQQHSKGKTIIALYIDNSFSMMGEGSEGQLLEEAKKRAESIVKASSEDSRFVIQDNDNKAVNHFLLSKEKALTTIKAIGSSPIVLSMAAVSENIKNIVENNEQGARISLYMLSDYQKSAFDVSHFKRDSTVHYFFVPVSPRTVSNLYIDSCWFETPTHLFMQPEKLFVSIVNASEKAYASLPVKLFINDTSKAIASISLQAMETKTLTLEYNNTAVGSINGKIEINDYPIVYDNSYLFNYSIKTKFKVLIINEKDENVYLNSLFKDDASITVVNVPVSSVPYSTIADYDAVILSGLHTISDGLAQSLRKAVTEKIALLIFPDKKSSIPSYNAFLSLCNAPLLGALDTAKVRAGIINYKHPVFANVFKHEIANADLPSFFAHFKIIKPSHSATNDILTAESSDELVVSTNCAAGIIYLFASPCNDNATSLVKHPLFVPLILNMVMNASSLAPLQYKIGSSTLVTVPVSSSDNALIHIVNKQKNNEFIPQQLNIQNGAKTRLMLGGYISDAGFYTVTSDKKNIAELAFNYNRMESKMEFFNPTEIRDLASRYVILSNVIDKPKDLTGESIKQMDKGIMLWKWLIVACLLFILMEVLLVKFFRF